MAELPQPFRRFRDRNSAVVRASWQAVTSVAERAECISPDAGPHDFQANDGEFQPKIRR